MHLVPNCFLYFTKENNLFFFFIKYIAINVKKTYHQLTLLLLLIEIWNFLKVNGNFCIHVPRGIFKTKYRN